ncbi:MAG: hypothetical protein GY762_19905 [Proteobacteria bacterium]|nr:hypothetical protein [Pseudomonadota bacterium]
MVELLQARRKLAEPYVNAVRRSLDELARYAQGTGVRLGGETRLHLH